MNSQSVAGLLGAIVASIVMVVAIAYGPIGQFGKPAKPASFQQPRGASAGSCGASPARAGDSGSAELVGAGLPLAECPGRSYLIFNGDVDASKLRRWDDHE